MAQPIEQFPYEQSGDKPPYLNGEYTSVKILDGEQYRPKRFWTKFGEIALHTLQVELVREYENRAPRATQYEALAAYRTDADAPDQTLYPVVGYSNALLTTPRKPNTATNRYFLNPVYEGFSSINMSVKQRPGRSLWGRAVPHTISLAEMSDDELVATKHIAAELGLGQNPDANGLLHINKNGYSRGVQLSIVQAARAGLHGMIVDRAQGRGPGPHDRIHWLKVGQEMLNKGGKEGSVIWDQIRQEPHHAFNNYLNVITHRPDELMSYVGDAAALLTGTVSKSMHHINPDLRGYVTVLEHDPFGRHKEYVVNYNRHQEFIADNIYQSHLAPNYYLLHKPGAHLSGLSQSEVLLDRLGWQAERDYLDGKSDKFMPQITTK